MRIAFVYRGAENLGLEYLSSFLKAHGHEVRLFFDPASFSGERGSNIPLLAALAPDWVSRIASAVARYSPDLVGFSVYTSCYQWALRTARAIREQVPAPIVFGGVHVTGDPARVLRQEVVDAVVVGEGEGAILDIVESLRKGKISRSDIPNVGVKDNGRMIINPPRPYIRDLDSLPPPDKELFYEKSAAFSHVYLAMTSRGCPFRCHYCMNSLYPSLYPNEHGHVRRQSVDRVIRELEPWRAVSRMVSFWDDVFPLDRSWLSEFASKYPEKIGLPFLCFVHPRSLTLEMAQMLARAGCAGVKIGVESVSETGRKFLGRTGTTDEARRAALILKEVGIPFSMDHMLGLPGEGEKELMEAVKFYIDTQPIRINSHWLSYLPGSRLLEEECKKGNLKEAEAEAVREGVGQTTFMHPRNKEGTGMREALAAMMAFDLIPLIPASWINRLIRKGLPKWLRYNRIVHQALLVIASLKARDAEMSGYVRYAFGRKRVP